MIPWQIKKYNAEDTDIQTLFKFTAPDFLSSNLTKKKLLCNYMYINNSKCPAFIPKQATSDFLLINSGSVPTNIVLNQVQDINSLQYYMILRKNDNTEGAIMFIKHIPTNPLAEIPSYIKTGDNFTSDPYYWYSDYSFFLKIIESSINELLDVLGLADENGVMITNTATTATLYLDRKITTNNYQLEFSPELYYLLPFKCILNAEQNSYILLPSEVSETNGDITMSVNECDFWDKINPFFSIVVTAKELPCTTRHYTNLNVISEGQTTDWLTVVLEFGITPNNINQKNYYQYSTSEPFPNWIFFDKDTIQTKTIANLNVYYRMKNDFLIPAMLAKGEICILNFQVHDK